MISLSNGGLMKVKLKNDFEIDTVAIEKNKEYEVISIEKGWYRIMTELDEDYLFPSSMFDIVN